MVDASNAFNSLNRQTALQNTRRLCPSLATMLINTYREPTDLFVDGDVLSSKEGTTQGDPLAMPMYAIATAPLIQKLNADVTQIWYADDASGVGRLPCLRRWWDQMNSLGPGFGYFANAVKTWLITKEEHLAKAKDTFAGTNVQITTDGKPHLGAPIGSLDFRKHFVDQKVQEWCNEVRVLSSIAHSKPQAAYAAFTHGMISKWTFLLRTVPDIQQNLQPLENMIRSTFIPAVTGRSPPNDSKRTLFALPTRLGGIGLADPSIQATFDFNASVSITESLTDAISSRSSAYSYEIIANQLKAKSEARLSNRSRSEEAADALKETLTGSLRRAMSLAQEKGSSSWLSALPIKEYGFSLHKGAFFDALALRYDWHPARTPSHCDCGANFSIEHSLSCPKGGFPTIRHNEIRDLTASLMTEVCNDVQLEPDLQPLTGEQLTYTTANVEDGARLDIAANGFWGGRYERTFIDVRIFNPHAPSNRNSDLATCYRKHERSKKRAYEQRVREVEHASFTPLVLSASGGMARGATNFYKNLASKLAMKWNQSYSTTISWLRCRLTFSLLQSSIQCIRGSRSSQGHACKTLPQINLVTSVSHLSHD